MKEKVLALAKGEFTYETPKLMVEPDLVRLEVEAGSSRTANLTVYNSKGSKVKGFASVSHTELNFLPVFNGEKNVLDLEIDGRGKQAGESIKGVITFVTDCGEKEIPYEISFVAPALRTKLGTTIDDYYKLQQLILEYPEEAMEVFRSDKFREVFLYRDEMGEILYNRLTENNPKLQGAEEFLVTMGKKEAVSFRVKHLPSASGKIVYYQVEETDMEDSLQVRINKKGDQVIRVRAEGDFIEIEKHLLETRKFKEGKFDFDYKILADKVGQGIRRGSIVFESNFQRQEIVIEVHNVIGAKERKIERAKRQAFALLVRNHLDFREGKVSQDQYRGFLTKNRAVIEKIFPGKKLLVDGYMAVVLKKEKELLAFYQKTENLKAPEEGALLEEVETYLLIQYIKYLVKERGEDREALSNLLETYENKGYASRYLFLLGLEVHAKYDMDQWLIQDLRDQIEKGSASPYYYSKLVSCFEKNHQLLLELDHISLAAVHYGFKQDLISEELAVNVAYLAHHAGDFDELLYQVLTEIYDSYQIEEALVAICEMVIRSQRRSHKYFKWMELGVEKHLRITDLYEYYMYTMDEKTMVNLPEAVLSYFQYENHMTDRNKCFLYAYIVSKKETIPDYYNLYEANIREYAIEQIKRHKINRELGLIYADVLTQMDIPEDVSAELPYIMFREQITCDNPKMESLVVVHRELNQETTYPLQDGKARVNVYTGDVAFLFVDREGHYHGGTVSYSRERLLPLDDFSLDLCGLGIENYGLTCHVAARTLRKSKLSDLEVKVLEEALAKAYFRPKSTGRIHNCLYEYYKSKKKAQSMMPIVEAMDMEGVKVKKLGEIASFCLRHGMYEKAEAILMKYGIRDCDHQALLALIQHLERIGKDDFSPYQLKWCEFLYDERCYDKSVLDYLMKYYMGSTRKLTGIFKRCQALPNQEMDDGSKEKVLGQVLFTNADPLPYTDLYLDYHKNGKNRILVKAFLSHCAYEYLVGRLEPGQELKEKIQKEAYYVKDDVMILAHLYSCAKTHSLTDREKEFVEISLEKFAGEGRIMSFMKDFAGRLEVPYEIENPAIVQYMTGSAKSVELHLEKKDGSCEILPMRQVFQGIFTAALLLFEGEVRKGFIQEVESGKKTDTFTIVSDIRGKTEGSFFQMLDSIQAAKRAGREEECQKLLRQYETRQKAANELFEIR
ncbi:MAG: DUF5717 family protein [Eubacterium sp.]|nr:DUF5717 family protein [Eubacterium sp.]